MDRVRLAVASQRKSEGNSFSVAKVERWARRLAADTEKVLAVYPEADADDVRRTLIALQSSPLERLNRSLRRGRGFAALDRILASKRAANREKDKSVIPALENAIRTLSVQFKSKTSMVKPRRKK